MSPRELEEVLLLAEGVSEAAVVGVPHPRTGEAPRAYVVPKPSAHLSPTHLQQFVAGGFLVPCCLYPVMRWFPIRFLMGYLPPSVAVALSDHQGRHYIVNPSSP